jgi:hypothetical protein
VGKAIIKKTKDNKMKMKWKCGEKGTCKLVTGP